MALRGTADERREHAHAMRGFLIGGGRDPDRARAAHEPFIAAAGPGGPITALVLDEGEATDVDRWATTLASAGAGDVRVRVVAPGRPPTAADVAGAAGVYVAGGWTLGYHDVLVAGGTAWLQAARAAGAVYGGFSAGCAIAPRRALVGGWRAEVGGRRVEVCSEEAGEDLDAVDVRDGLGLLPGAADVHAAQWGTLQRLLHAVVGGAAPVGWAVDEHTVLEVDGGAVRVHGEGAVHRVLPLAGGGARIDAFVAGAVATAEGA